MNRKNPLQYVRPNILALEPYSTARDEFTGGDISVWVDANENPFNNGVNRYPDPHHRKLKEVVASLKGFPASQIFLGGAGSDEAIDLTFRIFCTPGKDNAIAISPSYGVYRVSAAINDIELREVRLNDDFSLPVDRLLEAADSRSKLMWICSPNNPTANAFARADLLRLCDEFDGMVVVDEAYVDFSEEGSLRDCIAAHPNLIILQTFSKAWGMAGLRFGMAFAAAEIIAIYNNVKYPYNINGPTQAALIERITATAPEVGRMVDEITADRRMLSDGLSRCACVEQVYPSDANFLLVKVTDAGAIYDYLIANGVIVRNRSSQPGCADCLRITVGTHDENLRILDLMRAYVCN